MNVCQPAFLAELLGFFVGFIPDQAVLHNFGAVSARGIDLRLSGIARHHHDSFHLVDARGQRHTLSMISCGRADHATFALLRREMTELVQRSAQLV